ARATRGGSGRGRWLVVSSTTRRGMCGIPNATVKSKCWAARSIMLDGRKPRLGVTLRRHLRDHQPCPSNIPERGLRFACAPRSPVATGSDPLSTDLLVAGKASRPAVSQLATTHRRDQAHANEKRARGPASASASKEPSQVRTRLSAGGNRIRTLGPPKRTAISRVPRKNLCPAL